MATFQWVVREVDRELAAAVVDAAKRQGQRTGDLLNAIIRAWVESGGDASSPADTDLRTAVAQLAERVEALEARQERRGASKPGRQAELFANHQSASSGAPEGDDALSVKLPAQQEAAARLMAEIEATGAELFAPSRSGDPAGRRLSEAGEDAVRRLFAELPSFSGVARLIGVNKATVKRVVEAGR